MLLLALTAPVIQWNRAVLSESIAISLTVLLLAAWLAFARRMDGKSTAALLVVTVLWTFTRQDQAFVVFILFVPFAFVTWLRPQARRVALVGLLGVALIGIWGTATALQGSKSRAELQLAGIVQFRAATNPGEMTYLRNHGLPRTSALKLPPPFTTVGQPVNVTQFADPFAQYRLGDDPQFQALGRCTRRHGPIEIPRDSSLDHGVSACVSRAAIVDDESRLHPCAGTSPVGVHCGLR